MAEETKTKFYRDAVYKSVVNEVENLFMPSYVSVEELVAGDCPWRCFLFCWLFPKDYEFDKYDIVEIWIAQDLIPEIEDHRHMEDIGSAYFAAFVSVSFLQYSHYDHSLGRCRYKLNPSIYQFLQTKYRDSDYFAHYCICKDGWNIRSPQKSMYYSFHGHIEPSYMIQLQKYPNLQTLLLHPKKGSFIDQISRDLFLSLPNLKVLDLSQNNITELPSSIGNLKNLRYLNLSGNPINVLPNSLCVLKEMQTLKLIDCTELVYLPKDLRKLVKLRHLYLDAACHLTTMSPGIGDLDQLQTLPLFIVGKETGRKISELKKLSDLRGSLRITGLENVPSSDEARESCLVKKLHLKKLELQWINYKDGAEILEGLQPCTNLEELQIVGYGGAKFPCWIGDPMFSKLTSVTLFECSKCELLPPLGRLPLLKFLCIRDIHDLKIIDHQFCGREVDIGCKDLKRLDVEAVTAHEKAFTAFPRLETLILNHVPSLEEWTGFQEGDFSCMVKLNISGGDKLTVLPDLSLFTSLEQLEITMCPLIKYLPPNELPASLQSLFIVDCPLIKERCQDKDGEDVLKIAHLTTVSIDYEELI